MPRSGAPLEARHDITFLTSNIAQTRLTSKPSAMAPVLARIIQCAVKKRCWFLVGASPTRQLVAPAGSSRSGSGGNEAVEAFDGKGSLRRLCEQTGRNASERRAGLEKRNAGADPSLRRGRPPLRSTRFPTEKGEARGDRLRSPAGVVTMACLHGDQRNTGSPVGGGA